MNPLHAIPLPVPVPVPDSAAALHAARALLRQRHLLSALQAFHEQLGDVFRLPLPGFSSVVLVGPDANRFLLLEARGSVRWRAETDPVTRLLEHGVLVTDGAVHDELRQAMSSNFHKTMLEGYLGTMWRMTDRVADEWGEGSRVDLFAQMRRVALLILTDTLFSDDFGAPMDLLWHDIVRTLHYIAPGPWLLWPGVPRPGYRRARQRLDAYLFGLIARRRTHPRATDDLLGSLIAAGLRDDVIRDQLLTMFIAGHDTSTALLAWTLYLLLRHPEALARVQSEIDAVIGAFPPAQAHLRQLRYLDRVVKETLRLYPPIHLGSRIATDDVVFQKYQIAAGTRILYSPYLTHHDARVWPAAEQFDPDRFAPEHAHERPPYAFLPFGGGPRNCMGAASPKWKPKSCWRVSSSAMSCDSSVVRCDRGCALPLSLRRGFWSRCGADHCPTGRRCGPHGRARAAGCGAHLVVPPLPHDRPLAPALVQGPQAQRHDAPARQRRHYGFVQWPAQIPADNAP